MIGSIRHSYNNIGKNQDGTCFQQRNFKDCASHSGVPHPAYLEIADISNIKQDTVHTINRADHVAVLLIVCKFTSSLLVFTLY